MGNLIVIKKDILENPNVSLDAKWLYSILYTKWWESITIKYIAQELWEKEEKILKLFNELKKYWYIRKDKSWNIYLY